MYPIYDFGGSGQIVNLLPANGFPPETYIPLLKPLTDRYHVICMLPRALWHDEKPPKELRQWDMLAEDLLAGLAYHKLDDVIAIGHSFGGTASMIAVTRQLKLFNALCLLDPTLFRSEWLEGMEQMQRDGSIVEFPLVQGAMRRRRSFETVEAAFAYFKTKRLFADWPDKTLHLYVEHGLQPAADGGFELRWSPEWEAYYFSTGFTRSWEVAPKLRGLLPVLAIGGGTTDTYVPEIAAMLQEVLPEAAFAEVAGHGHLFPQTAPQQTLTFINQWLEHSK
ncbi:MAG: alpha/beta fold hydrolase [Anaerolineaceae bacterium]|nr:alpha/beta fold hydrolase [Anaerolineaceae bacterium]